MGTCRHCGANLDKGDIFEHFMSVYDNEARSRESASNYGWSDTNKKRFSRAITVQPENGEQYTICPECKKRDPFFPSRL